MANLFSHIFWSFREMRRRLRPRLLDLYLITETSGLFIGSLVFFTFILLMLQVLRQWSALIEHSAPLLIVAKIFGYLTLNFLPLVLPFAFLLSVFVAFARLSSDGEFMAIRANGLSVARMTVPVVALSLIVSASTFGPSLDWSPKAAIRWRSTMIRLTNTAPINAILPVSFISSFFGLMLYAEQVDMSTRRLKNVFIFDDRLEDSPKTIAAPDGKIVPMRVETKIGSRIRMRLRKGEIYENGSKNHETVRTKFETFQINLSSPEGSDSAVGNFLNYSYNELIEAQEVPRPSIKLLQLFTELWIRRYAPLLPILFASIGIGLGCRSNRKALVNAGLLSLAIMLPTYACIITG
ncbi:MAG: LptF/LptG family permease [Cryobacterium sp.]|nr:LptF/LptG family permease [Oligoflexia bacterium]